LNGSWNKSRGSQELMDFLNRYLSLGWSVIPLKPRSKTPATTWRQYQQQKPDGEWNRWRVLFPIPPYNLAVVCGRISGLIVLDADDLETAARLRAVLPFETPEVITRRGAHFYFAYQENIPSTIVELPGIGRVEVRSDNVLTTLPPSIHESGDKYQWALAPWEAPKLPDLPDFIVEAVEEKEHRKELARQVGWVTFPRPGCELTLEVLREILTAVGATVVREIAPGGREAWRLKECPLCGKSEGSPWVWTDTGRLVDFRVTCPASRDKGGLSLRAWLKELGREDLIENLKVEEREEVPPSDVPVASVEEARQIILEALRSGRDLFLAVPPGVGKSVTTLECLVHEGPRPAVYSVPTHELAEELAERARGLTTELVALIKGRSSETCLAWAEAEQARRLGYNPGEVLCPLCPHNPNTAVAAKKCTFMRQFESLERNRGIYLADHVLAAHLLKRELRKARVWVLDEDPLKLVHQVEISTEGLRTLRAVLSRESETLKLVEKILALGDELHRVVSETGKGSGRIYPRSPGYGPWANRKSLAEWLKLDFTALAPKIREEIERIRKTFKPRKLFNFGVNLHALRWVEEVVGRGVCHLAALRDPKRPVVLRRTEILTPSKWKGRVIALDATGYLPVVQRLLDRPHLEELNLQVPVKACTVWIKAAVSKTAINKRKGRKRVLDVAEKVIKEFDSDQTLVFAHKDLKKQVSKLIQQGALAHHFGSEARGVNRFEGFDTVVLLGLPVPNPATYYDTAVALGLDGKEFEEWLDLVAKAEAWQEVNRIRPVLSLGKSIVVVAPRWPFELWLGPPQEIKDLTVTGSKIAWAVKVLLLWLDVFGFVIMEIALLLGIGREGQIPPEEVRAEVWARIRKNFPERSSKFKEALFSLKGPDTPLRRAEGNFGNKRESNSRACHWSFNIFKDPDTPLSKNTQIFLEVPEIPQRACRWSLRLSEIHFKDPSWWRQLIRRIRKACPGLSIFEVRLQTPGGPQWTRGLGNIKAAQAFYQALGREIDPNSWREVT